MKTLNQLLLAAAGIAILLAALMGLNLIASDIMEVSGRGFLDLASACSLLAIALHVVKPCGGGEG
jgi:hypothetical protein